MLGRTIGNYEVVSQFGEGGMGELYLGRHTRLAREVIIKTIRTEDFSARQVEHLRDRLEREAFIQSQLDHPNIVRVYDFIAVGDTTCIVMEYVPGRDLRKMISRETGPIAASRATRRSRAVAVGTRSPSHRTTDREERNGRMRSTPSSVSPDTTVSGFGPLLNANATASAGASAGSRCTSPSAVSESVP